MAFSTVEITAAKTHFLELLRRVEGGERIAITRRGRPVAMLVPAGKSHNPAERRRAIAEIRALGKGLSLGGGNIREWVACGRR